MKSTQNKLTSHHLFIQFLKKRKKMLITFSKSKKTNNKKNKFTSVCSETACLVLSVYPNSISKKKRKEMLITFSKVKNKRKKQKKEKEMNLHYSSFRNCLFN